MEIRKINYKYEAQVLAGCGNAGETDTSEFVNPEKLIATLQYWEGLYDDFYRIFNEMDIAVAESVNVSATSCVYGIQGDRIYKTWEEKVLPWKNVYYMLRRMSSNVIDAMKNVTELQEFFNEGQGEKLGGADLIQREADLNSTAAADARMLAAIRAGRTEIDGIPINIGADGKFTYNGQEYTVTYGEDGRIESVKVGDQTYDATVPNPSDYYQSGATPISDPTSLVADSYAQDFPTVSPITVPASDSDHCASHLYANAENTRQNVDACCDVLAQTLYAMGLAGKNLDKLKADSGDYSPEVQYLLQQYQAYHQVSKDLDTALASGSRWDGPLTNAVPYGDRDMEVDGVDIPNNFFQVGSESSSYGKATNTANDINQQISNLPSLEQIQTELSSMDNTLPLLTDLAASNGD